MNNKIKAVIFDLDGVLFQTHDENGRYLWSKHAKEDLGLTREHFSCIYGEYADVIKGKRTKYEHLSHIFATNNLFENIRITVDEYVSYWLKHDTGVDSKMVCLVKDINALVPCYIGTNQEELRTKHVLDLIGRNFLGCFASHNIGAMKPEKEFFQYIQKTLLLDPYELLLIDDTKNHTIAAENCGWHVYHYQNDIEALVDFLKKHEVVNESKC